MTSPRDKASYLPVLLGPVELRTNGTVATPRGILNFEGVTATDNEGTNTLTLSWQGDADKLDGKDLDAPAPADHDILQYSSALAKWLNWPLSSVNIDAVDFGANARVSSKVVEKITDDGADTQSFDDVVYAVPASTVVDAVGTAIVVNLSDATVDLIDFRRQFQRNGSGALAGIGTPDNTLKIGGGDQSIGFDLTGNSIKLNGDAVAGDTRHWTITMQFQAVKTT